MTEHIPDGILPRFNKTDKDNKHDYFIDDNGRITDESGREIIWKLSDRVKHDKEREILHVTKKSVLPFLDTTQILRYIGGENVELLEYQKIEEYVETIDLDKIINPAFQTDPPQVRNEGLHIVKKRLTREDGMASRRKGIEGQRRFAQFLMRIMPELLDNYGQDKPDYHLIAMNVVLAVGQHKGYTLNEVTKQRRISSKDLVSAEEDVKEYRVPMIIFVTNFSNGQIWASSVRFENYDNFKGITTPVELLKTDEKSQKFLMDSIVSVLAKAGFDQNLVEKETRAYFSNLQKF